jgi:hypothetical protein
MALHYFEFAGGTSLEPIPAQLLKLLEVEERLPA